MIIVNAFIVIVCLILCAIFWRIGGDGDKWVRMILVPSTIALSKILLSLSLGFKAMTFSLYALLLWLALTLFSYGISALPHKFVVLLFGGKGKEGNYMPVEFVTRAICAFFWALSASIFCVFGVWWKLIIYVIFLTVMNGVITVKVKNVEVAERLVGFCAACAVFV